MAGGEQYRGIHKSGSVIIIEVNAEIIRDIESNPSKMVFIARDITKRKLEEEAESQEKYLLDTLMGNTPDHIYFKDLKSKLLRASKSLYEKWGAVDQSKVIGKTDFDFFTIEHAQQAYDDEQNIINTGQTLIKEEKETWGNKPDTWVYSIKMPLKDKNGVVIGTFGISRDITERKQKEDEIQRLLQEKEMILKEVHHRIKNNMSTIQSLLTLQASTLNDKSAIDALEDAANRVRSMTILYNELYNQSFFESAPIKNYLPVLVDDIVNNFPNSNIVEIELKIEDFEIPAKFLQPLGIILNELITNIMKYAFGGRDSGKIIVIASQFENKIHIEVDDNGIGMPEGVNFKTSNGFGMMLIDNLTNQLNGVIKILRNNGTQVILDFEE